mgnify:CR=1 FL=1
MLDGELRERRDCSARAQNAQITPQSTLNYLDNGVLAGVVEHGGQGRGNSEELGVGAGLDTLVGLSVAIPLASGQLELASGPIRNLPRGLGPAVGPGACKREPSKKFLDRFALGASEAARRCV